MHNSCVGFTVLLQIETKNNGETIEGKWLTHISLLSYKHVIPMGSYFTDSNLQNR
jgi:hypothetical protein